MAEEKELTIEEMKSLVSLATLLPALLEKIATINKDIAELKASFFDIKAKFNTNTNAVIEYKNSVDKLIQNQTNIQSIEEKLDLLKKDLFKKEIKVNNEAPAPKQNSKKTIETKSFTQEKKTDEVMDKVNDIVFDILADHRGRKTRLLTIIDIKTKFKASDEVALKVLQKFEETGMYDPKMHMLTFPKR